VPLALSMKNWRDSANVEVHWSLYVDEISEELYKPYAHIGMKCVFDGQRPDTGPQSGIGQYGRAGTRKGHPVARRNTPVKVGTILQGQGVRGLRALDPLPTGSLRAAPKD
jgi:hypothetical protein